MREKIVILGATPFSSLMRCYLEQDDSREVVAYAVETPYLPGPEFDGRPTVAFEKLAANYRPTECLLCNTIGYVQMNSVRERIQKTAAEQGYRMLTYVHPSSVVNSPLGAGCIVLENSSIGFRNKIGDGCIVWSNVSIPHDCVVGAYSYWSPGATSCGNVEIGERCFIGANAVLRNRIKIAPECLIGAGAYLASSVAEPQSVYTGATASRRKLSARSIF